MTTVPSQSNFNVHQAVTEKIVAMIEAGPGTYKAPWHAPQGGMMAFPVNAATHASYRGVNILTLWLEAQLRGYASPFWASYRQWQSLHAQVRKGERGNMIVFYRRTETKPFDNEDDDRRVKLHFFARASHVFNAAQVDGFAEPQPEQTAAFQRIEEVEAFVRAVNATIHHSSGGACYKLALDVIEMPHREWFVASDRNSAEESYYAVLLHELTHWTGAAHRLNRDFGRRFGDQRYAMEELVAELGAAFMCAAFGIGSEPRADHAAYVSSWLEVLGRDAKAIFTAANKAQEAFDELAYLAARPDLSPRRD